ncbi:Bacterio-opsin activator HTH domain-containing protein [Halorubrum distributum JCM 9100]|uniref:Bacterio-opsin activator HTH domain-containing protein n=3 Tax=Halorubrum distributum TaxID=29283 RepID=M0EQC8_9EURY|nr:MULTISPECIES: helix-turn-helix domain-containing protein [Halorubrum distributum group]ELZ48624.1 Bacterio-opsin activator HTH domain-containing protein [Halorubrum distributum JCM 9100]ELZ51679.1 Bacterio-opsin activator HTH domain-containing protein [Halorubrum distributum JCM 10118]MYL67677.1 bacterio-opsin activator [Halorubrum terrestre]
MVTNDAGDDGHAVVIEIDPCVDVAAVLGTIADLDIDGVRIRDVRDEGQSTVSIDPEELTAVQRRTLLRAVEAGYYADPREVTLTDLAGEFDVSKSAVSQRLHGAEATIVRRVVEEMAREEPLDSTIAFGRGE